MYKDCMKYYRLFYGCILSDGKIQLFFSQIKPADKIYKNNAFYKSRK